MDRPTLRPPGDLRPGVRLDVRDEALVPRHGDNHLTPIVPGDPTRSEVWKRIITDDADELMPPPDSHLVLTPKQKETIRLWIEQGAEYQPHWAFLPVKKNLDAIRGPMNEATPFQDWQNWRRAEAEAGSPMTTA